MDPSLLRRLLEQVRDGETPVEEAMARLRALPYEDLGFARLDTHRAVRSGFPEVVFCQGKTADQALEIVRRLAARNRKVIATRVSPDLARRMAAEIEGCVYHEVARVVVVDRSGGEEVGAAAGGGAGKGAGRAPGEGGASPETLPRGHPSPAASGTEGASGASRRSSEPSAPPARRSPPPSPLAGEKYVMVVSAGTADLPVAEEAAVTAEALGSRVERAYDVGVAGLHRLLDEWPRLAGANVLVVVAGMEGALASVVGGLVGRPVIAVPTSVGYGASFGGLAALLAMLNSCAAGVAVTNIDNGFGAGYLAHLINK